MTKEQAMAQSHNRSALNRFASKGELQAKGVDESSPIARLNTRKRMTQEERRQFFRDKAGRQGLLLLDDPTARYDDLSLKDKLTMKWGQLLNLVGANSRSERGAIAVDWALDHAIGKSAQEYQDNRLQPQIVKQGRGLKGPVADAIDESDAFRDQSYKLTEAGIEEGKKKLKECLNLDPDANYNEEDKQKLVDDFERWAHEYNDVVDDANRLRAERRNVMSKSVLEELGMPMLTMDELTRPEAGGEARFDKMYAEEEEAYLKEIGSRAGISAKSVLVGLGVAGIVALTGGIGSLAFLSKGVRRAVSRALASIA